MPPQPLLTPPPVETSGAYRLVTIGPFEEAPWILALNAYRESQGRRAAVVDEWDTESARLIALGLAPRFGRIGETITTDTYEWPGGASCNEMLLQIEASAADQVVLVGPSMLTPRPVFSNTQQTRASSQTHLAAYGRNEIENATAFQSLQRSGVVALDYSW